MKRALAAAMLAALLGAAGPAAAHPHGWIDLQVTIGFDDQGRIATLRETWLFDDAYSAFATGGMDNDGDGRPDQALLEELLQENISNLAEYDYFTKVRQDERSIGFGTPTDLATRMAGSRLEIAFTLPLAEPVSPRDGAFSYSIYDPTYYIEMVHAEDPAAIRLQAAPEDCHANLLPPNPTGDQVAMASALDATQTGWDGLGALFAEVVPVRCGD
ncbi:DUF1007 family protein [Marinibaculum pumilum]|uniref:DUF1007 family protein n=1 Tax=Marinibaculum pumilum TaxID=1766165 RepID=A0ABV7L926_9PROT